MKGIGQLRLELPRIREYLVKAKIALSFRDVRRGAQREMGDWGFPLVTVGNANIPQLVGRPCSTVSSFRYTAPWLWRWQLYYRPDASLPLLIPGLNPKLVGAGRETVKNFCVAGPLDSGTPRVIEEARRFGQPMRVFSGEPT